MRFDDVVRSALDELPAKLAAGLRNVAVVVEDENAEDPDLYGLFEGIPLTEGGPGAGGRSRSGSAGRRRRRRRAVPLRSATLEVARLWECREPWRRFSTHEDHSADP